MHTVTKKQPIDNTKTDVKSAARTLDILELLANFPDGLWLTDIEKRLDIPLSSLHNLLKTISNRGYVVKLPSSNIYRLGPRLVQLAASYRSQSNLVSLSDPAMEKLKQLTCETTSLTILQGNMILFIHKHPAEGRVQIVNPVGTRLHTHATGSGKVMLAYLPEADVDRIYPQEELPTFTSYTISTRTQLKKELAEIRKQGYALDKEESENGVWAVAGCIHATDGSPVASISVVAPIFRLEGKDYLKWPDYVVEAAQEISAQLQFNP